MSAITDKLLMELLDGEVAEDRVQGVMADIYNDPAAREQWEYLLKARDTIKYAALVDQVAAIKKQYDAAEPIQSITPQKAIIRKISFNVMKVAACVLVAIGSWSMLKYSLTTPADIYEHSYSSYQLSTSRGVETTDKLEKSYQQKNWNEVVLLFNKLGAADNKSTFLTAVSEMELKRYADAIRHLNTILTANALAKEGSFQDEAQYYLALCYLATGQTTSAASIFNQVKANPDHLYNKTVRNMSFIDQQVLKHANHH